MQEIIESEFESLSIFEIETLLMWKGKLVSRREFDGIIIFLYAIHNRFAQISYYSRSHEIIGVSLITRERPEFESCG